MKLRPGLIGLFLMVSLVVATDAVVAQSSKRQTGESIPLKPLMTVGDITVVGGQNSIQIENVGLVVGLHGTGSDPNPSRWKTRLLEIMRRNAVPNPKSLLARSDTALVIIRAFLPPGARPGDLVDAEVVIPDGSEVTNLRHGWLMEADLMQTMHLGGRIREGRVLSKVDGPIVVASDKGNPGDTALQRRGRLLGRVRVTMGRSYQMIVAKKYRRFKTSRQLEQTINGRFRGSVENFTKGAATAKTFRYIDLAVDDRYRHNQPRYLEVVRHLALGESLAERNARAKQLEAWLLSNSAKGNPADVSLVALQLEGMSNDGKSALRSVLEKSRDSMIRFYVAEALAYFGDPASANELGRAAIAEPAYRVYALTALASLAEPVSYDVLSRLMDAPSAELRYGAFRAMRVMNPSHPLVKEQDLYGLFYLHIVASKGSPMIHATRSSRAELVLFGGDYRLETPLLLKAGDSIYLDADAGSSEITVKRFSVSAPVKSATCSARLSDVVITVVQMGGTYTDVIEMLFQAQQQKNFEGIVAMDAIPRAGRRPSVSRPLFDSTPDEPEAGWLGQLPTMFAASFDESAPKTDPVVEKALSEEVEEKKEETSKREPGFFAKLLGRSRSR